MQGPVTACMTWKPSENLRISPHIACIFIPATIQYASSVVADAPYQNISTSGRIQNGMWLGSPYFSQIVALNTPCISLHQCMIIGPTLQVGILRRPKPSVFIEAVDAPRGRT